MPNLPCRRKIKKRTLNHFRVSGHQQMLSAILIAFYSIDMVIKSWEWHDNR